MPGSEQVRSQAITALAPAPDGGLWIGTRHSLWHLNGSVLQDYRTVDGTKEIPVSAIQVDHGGNVWVGTVGFVSGGLGRLENNKLHFYTPAEGFAGGGVFSLGADHQGNLWVGCVNGLYRSDGSRFQEYGSLRLVTAISEGPDGQMRSAANGGQSLKRLVSGTIQDYTLSTREGLSTDTADSVVTGRSRNRSRPRSLPAQTSPSLSS
jgi:ligand-binding sensor domain-containing protein